MSANLTNQNTTMEVNVNTDGSSSTVENLQSLLQFVRQSKDEATSRAMTAEVEMRRLRAETAEYERGRNELLRKIRDLETEKIATTAALVEKASLMEKIQALTDVHNINAKLTEEKTKLQAQLHQIQKEKADLEKQRSRLSASNEEQKLKIASSDQEANQRKREIEQLKQRVQTNARGAASQPQLDQLKAQLATARQESAAATAKAKAAE